MGYRFEEDQSPSTKKVGIKILTIKLRPYKIKKRYGLKGLPDGFFIYSRYIMPAKNGSSYKRCRISGPFASRKEAVRVTKNLKKKSDRLIKKLMRKYENSK
jgi:hypothetical protein